MNKTNSRTSTGIFKEYSSSAPPATRQKHSPVHRSGGLGKSKQEKIATAEATRSLLKCKDDVLIVDPDAIS